MALAPDLDQGERDYPLPSKTLLTNAAHHEAIHQGVIYGANKCIDYGIKSKYAARGVNLVQ